MACFAAIWVNTHYITKPSPLKVSLQELVFNKLFRYTVHTSFKGANLKILFVIYPLHHVNRLLNIMSV